MSLFGAGISGWILHTYRKLRFLAIIFLILGLVLWYFNSVLFYDTIDGMVTGAVTGADMVKEFFNGF
tara:strand:- start:716 stop:916 length:201 start_codon:yes stop_codon:yes gene_type:complete